MRELGDCRGNLQTALKNDFLPLKANILRPLHESGEVSGGLDVLTYRFRSSGMAKPQKGHTDRCQSSWEWNQTEGS
jgi:hypothetical protein